MRISDWSSDVCSSDLFGALGSDTGGSIRWPCAANNLTGLKPTWGRVSRHGMFALAPSLDHVGPMARCAADAAVIMAAIAGSEPVTADAETEDAEAKPKRRRGGRRKKADAEAEAPAADDAEAEAPAEPAVVEAVDRKSTRLNSSH